MYVMGREHVPNSNERDIQNGEMAKGSASMLDRNRRTCVGASRVGRRDRGYSGNSRLKE